MVCVVCLVCLISHSIREENRHFNSSGRLQNLHTSNQEWVGPDATTKQTILFNSGVMAKCVDIPGSDMTNGNNIQIWDCNNNKNQMWYFDGLYIRSGINDQKCLDIPGGDYTNGNKLDLWDCNGLANQQFKVAGTYQWESVANPGKCIDLFGGDTTNGKLLEIWDCDKPAPGQTHYENPYNGLCLSDEVATHLLHTPGAYCAPYCGSDGSCPQDKPAGVTATPACDVSPSGGKNTLCVLQCESDGQCGAKASCKKNGACTYDDGPAPPPTPPPPSGQTHYDDPAKGCLSDETESNFDFVPGEMCTPYCHSDGSCPQDMPRGVTANPRCAFGSAGKATLCAMVCAISLPITDQKAADSQCGIATCHDTGQNFGVCTYAGHPLPGQTHYGDPGQGGGVGDCLSDESASSIPGVPGEFCAPVCNSDRSCPQDKPAGVTAIPQCFLKNNVGLSCALVCAISLPIKDQKAADRQCGAATCYPMPGVTYGVCAYAYTQGEVLSWRV
jgi:hypothetical protein